MFRSSHQRDVDQREPTRSRYRDHVVPRLPGLELCHDAAVEREETWGFGIEGFQHQTRPAEVGYGAVLWRQAHRELVEDEKFRRFGYSPPGVPAHAPGGVGLLSACLRYAIEKRDLADSIAELREIADGRNDILAEASGITAGSWYAWPSPMSAMS